MDRVKLNLPENFSFKATIPIRITDVNYGGHVGNDSFLSLIQEARLQFLQHFGYTETDIEGVGLIMIDAAIEYKAELFYGDIITIAVAAANFSTPGFDLFYLVEKQLETKNVVAAKAKTGMLFFNYTARKVMPVPQIFIDKIKA